LPPFSLDFGRIRSIAGRGKKPKPMDAEASELTVRACLAEVRIPLDKAVGIARAADACAGAGFSDKAVEITLDVEQPLYEASTQVDVSSWHETDINPVMVDVRHRG
jgi:hypothetical protein